MFSQAFNSSSISNSTDLVPVSDSLNLKLLHNYSTKTGSPKTDSEVLRDFYRTDFLYEASKYGCLPYCVIAFSAFHVVEQNEELLQTATYDQKPEIESVIEEY